MQVKSEFGHLLHQGRTGQVIRVHDPAKGLRIKRVWCYRCAAYHDGWPIKCECPPLWTCVMWWKPELCKQQQCVYCVDFIIPKRYPRLFNIQRKPATATATLALLAENESRFKARIATIRMNLASGWQRRKWRDKD